jgi:hypothetical protein
VNDNFNPARVGFVSTGTTDGDAIEAARIRKMLTFESEGLCPNGCAPLEWADDDPYTARCPACKFFGCGMTKAIYGGGM